MPYFKAFPKSKIPDPFSTAPWVDVSDPQDACGRIERSVREGACYPKLRVWVEDDIPQNVIDFKFQVAVISDDFEDAQGHEQVIHRGNFIEQAEEAAQAFLNACGFLTTSTLPQENEALKVLQELVTALDSVHSDPQYVAVWSFNQVHRGTYIGPMYSIQFNNAKKFLGMET